jgi:hypothetical protein
MKTVIQPVMEIGDSFRGRSMPRPRNVALPSTPEMAWTNNSQSK